MDGESFHICNNSDKEMNYLVDYAKPRLSRNRYVTNDVDDIQHPYEVRNNENIRKIVHKTVQTW